jgi:tetratricopeptide (TPR) repeat protein
MGQPTIAYEDGPWQVRIRRKLGGQPVGGGMFCLDGHIVTCAHVVAPKSKGPDGHPAYNRPAGPVYVEFPHAPAPEPIPAVVVDGGWFPPSGEANSCGDVAILELQGPTPAGVDAPPLRPSPRGVVKEHDFYAYGYPDRHSLGGSARGKIVGYAEGEWLSLLADARGQSLEPGFSGSPVWDVDLGGVVGIIVLRDVPRSEADRGGRSDPENGYAIKIEALGGYWPALQPQVNALPAESESLEDLLQLGLAADGELPTVAATSVYAMGVSPSKYVSEQNPEPTYVPRARIDRQVRELLDAGERFIVAVGDSKSGKSRSMAEMLHRLRPTAQLIVPAAGDPAALSKLARRPLPLSGEGGVLWLDEIDRYLVSGGLEYKVLLSFLDRAPRVTVVGTITSRSYHDITVTGKSARGRDVMTARDATAQFRQVLSRAKLVRVASEPSSEDLAAARRLYPDENFAARGIGEQMVAAPLIEDRYAAARETSPEGWAIIQAAVDWRRIGVSGPVSRAVLRTLFPHYLHEVAPYLEPDDERFNNGLDWATEPLAGTIALLVTVAPAPDNASYRAFDYVLACAEGQGPFELVPVAAAAWEEAVGSLDADELLVIIQAALVRGEVGVARQAAEAARQSADDPAAAARATLLLGELCAAAEEMDAAVKLLEEAAASGVSDVVPAAQGDLGTILAMRGDDPDRGRALLRSAIGAGDPQVTAQAQLSLGAVLMDQGDLSGARPLLEAAMAAHHDLAEVPFIGLTSQGEMERTRVRLPAKEADLAGRRGEDGPSAPVADDRSRVLQAAAARRAESVHLHAQASLGGLLVNEGDLTQARMLLDAALSSNNPEVEPLARTNLAALLLRSGDVAAAQEQFERILGSRNTGIAQFAQNSLGALLVSIGDSERGYELLEAVAASDNIDQGPRALCLLGEFYLQNGQLERARGYLQQAVDSEHRDWSPYANVSIAVLMAQEGDLEGARERLDAVIAARHPGESARAADVLGDLLLNAGDVAGAEDAYQRSIGFHHPWWSAVATADVSRILARRGEFEESTGLLRALADTDDPNVAPMALDLLGDLLQSDVGDHAGARDAYQRAIDSGHPDWSATAGFDLAQMLAADDDLADAEQQLRRITENPNRIYAAKAWDIIGDLLAESGDADAARDAYQRAIDADVLEWSARAQVDLARLILTETEQVDEAEPLLDSAAASGTVDVAASARLLLGLIAVYRGDPGHARPEFEQAAATGPPRVAGPALMQLAKIAMDDGDLNEAAEILEYLTDGSFQDEGLELYAAAHLGVVRRRQGDLGAALDLLQRAATSEDTDTAAYACLHWGVLAFDLDDVDAAAEILSRALGFGQPEVMNSIQASLGVVRVAQSRLDEARILLTAALEGGNREDEPKVRRYLGSVLARLGRADEARAALEPLADSDDQEHRPAGLLMLGRLAIQAHDVAAGQRWLGAAVEASDAEVAADARLELGRLLAESADVAGSRQMLTPLLDGPYRAQAEEILGEFSAAEKLAPTALPDSRPVPALSPAGPAAELPPLPAGVLSALADLAEAEGQQAEAAYWRSALSRTRDAG